jgi:hypothetical protein
LVSDSDEEVQLIPNVTGEKQDAEEVVKRYVCLSSWEPKKAESEVMSNCCPRIWVLDYLQRRAKLFLAGNEKLRPWYRTVMKRWS